MALFVAGLGLFGLSNFTAQQRTKEIAVRKVLGAENRAILVLLSRDFVKLVLVGNLIAWPAMYYLMSRWLEGFAYRISIDWLTFATAAVTVLLVALLTVSYQTIRAALANPVEALKYE